jgi:hypothetical protein
MPADNLISVDVVRLDGRLTVASEAENADLFWPCAAAAAISALSLLSSSGRTDTARKRCAAWSCIRWPGRAGDGLVSADHLVHAR